jgi:hypothetical protein
MLALGAFKFVPRESFQDIVVRLVGKVVAWSNPNACGPWFAG